MNIVRRVRGVVGMALTWGVAWSGLGLVLASIAFLIFRVRSQPLPLTMVLAGTLSWALLGLIGGAVFSIALSVAERGVQTVQELSVQRTALWGALAGLVVPLAYPNFWLAYGAGFSRELALIPMCSAMVAASAAASLAIARKSTPLLARPDDGQVLGVPES